MSEFNPTLEIAKDDQGAFLIFDLVKACEEEVLRRHRVKTTDVSSPVWIMIRVTKEDSGTYWLKQWFTVVGSQGFPKNWDSLEEFAMWAMVR
ncbi:Acyl-CoA N-acyltransferase [Penicillium majusculum]|nr:Acyl-CoA N-acyltransferase [Penicillium majusculum]